MKQVCPIENIETVGEMKKYLKQFADDEPIVNIDMQRMFTMEYNHILYLIIFRIYLRKLKKFIRGLFSLDEERVSTLVLLLICSWLIGLVYQITTNTIPTELTNVIVALSYGVALAGASHTATKYIHPKIKL